MWISTFIKRPVFTVMLVMLLVVFGLNSYPSLGIDLNPDVEFPIVNVRVNYTGASPEEMESLVTKKIEDAVSSVSGIKTLTSVSRAGNSEVTLEFEFGTDPKLAANEVREKVAGIRRRLPEQIDEPVVSRFDITAQPIIYFSLSSDIRSRGEIRKLANDIVKNELQRLDGVAEVNVYGATEREIHIYVDPYLLESYGISMQHILDTIDNQNVNTPGGHVIEHGTEITIRTMGKYTSLDELRNIVVANQQGRLIRLSDVAHVVDSWEEERVYASTNGSPSVMVAVQKQSGTNTVDVAERVKAAMQEIQRSMLPSDIGVRIVRDMSVYIRDSVHDVMLSIVFGGLLAVVITYLFLQSFRATIIGALAIPTSLIATFFLMDVMDFTLNNMSLMGLSLAVGILIDDAIVVIENIYRHMEEGKTPYQAALDGTKQIALAVIATTLSILAVFVPVGNMGEIIGQFFREFGLTVAFAVAFSLFVAFSLTPMLSAYWLKPLHLSETNPKATGWLNRILNGWERGFETLRQHYVEVLHWALARPKKLVALAVLSLMVNALFIPLLGIEFQPTYDSGDFRIVATAPAGTSLEKMKELTAPIEQEILSLPELDAVYTTIGANRAIYRANIGVRLVDASERQRSMTEIMDELRMKFRDIPGLKVSVLADQGTGRGDARPIQIGLRGPDLTILNQLAEELADRIRQIPGTADVDISSEQSEPEIKIKLDPARMGDAGVDAKTAGDLIQMAFLGMTTDNMYNIADSDYAIRVRLAPEYRQNIADVANLRLPTKTGSFVRLGDIAEVKLSSGPTRIDREGRQRQVVVYANTVGTTPGEVINKINNEVIPSMNLPLGYSYSYIGTAKTMQDSFREIVKALILAVVLIYMVLAAEFESFVHPFTIMLSLPFSVVGAILALLVTGKTINMMSLIGFIMLMGLVTKNAILLVDYTNELRAQGHTIVEALVRAGSIRLRPILMTTMAMIFGMLPVALGIGSGAELRSPMGVVLIGGLITSTILTLIIVPVVYLLIDNLQQRLLSRGSSGLAKGVAK